MAAGLSQDLYAVKSAISVVTRWFARRDIPSPSNAKEPAVMNQKVKNHIQDKNKSIQKGKRQKRKHPGPGHTHTHTECLPHHHSKPQEEMTKKKWAAPESSCARASHDLGSCEGFSCSHQKPKICGPPNTHATHSHGRGAEKNTSIMAMECDEFDQAGLVLLHTAIRAIGGGFSWALD